MGKLKGKSPKPAGSDIALDTLTDPLPVLRPGSPLKAADGHNVDGWADEDIRTYNNLLTERAKLEKEKNDLEQKSSRHQTQRALLDENATALDSLFKAQLGGDFKFTGSGPCCLDFDAACTDGAGMSNFPCKHEICSRAKSKGVSWMEMDTVKYYHARIMSEKSQRMQSALRKQRDVELLRVRKDDEEEAALRARRNAILDKATREGSAPAPTPKSDRADNAETAALDMLPAASKEFLLDPKNSAILDAAKENEHIVRRIRGRLDKIRHDVNAGRVSPADARVKLDQANSEMAEAERKNNEFRQMILDAEPALSQLQQPGLSAAGASSSAPTTSNLTTVLQNTLASSNADAFSQALNVMKGFFSASDPHDVQTAITDLRSVLELNGPMSPVLKKSFRALEDMLAKPNAKGFTVDVTTSDGKTRTCTNVVEVMMNLRLKMQGSDAASSTVDPDLNLDEDTIKANLECIKVEDAAKKEMVKIAERMGEDTVENVTAALKKIKAKAILKSPIPPLSDIVLDDSIADVLFRRSLKALMLEAEGDTALARLAGKLTALIIGTAQHKPEKYLVILRSAKDFVDKSKKDPPQVFLEAVAKVDESMAKFVANHEEKQKQSLIAKFASHPVAATPGAVANSSKPLIEIRYLMDGSVFSPAEYDELIEFLAISPMVDIEIIREHLYEYYHRNLEEGIWHMLAPVLIHPYYSGFSFEGFAKEKAYFTQNLQLAAYAPEHKLADTVSHFQQLGICPGRAAILVAQRMTLQIRVNFEVTKEQILALKTLARIGEPGNGKDWMRSFSFIAQTMTDMFGMLVYSLAGQDTLDVPIMGADLVGFLCTFVLGSMDPAQAERNLKAIEKLILHTLIENGNRGEGFKKLQDVFGRFVVMCQDSARFRCLPSHHCQQTFCKFADTKLSHVMPTPKANKTDKDPSVGGVPLPPSYITSGILQDTQLKALGLKTSVARHWEMAKFLTPHLICVSTERTCSCSEADRKFGMEMQKLRLDIDDLFERVGKHHMEGEPTPKNLLDDLNDHATRLRERPKSWPSNQQRLAELRAKSAKSRFAEHLPSELDAGDRSAHHSAVHSAVDMLKATVNELNLKQVAVMNPKIQESRPSSASQKATLPDKASLEALADHTNHTTHVVKKHEQSPNDDKSASPMDSDVEYVYDDEDEEDDDESTECDPWPMTEREVELRDQLLKFTDSVDAMHGSAKITDPNIDQAAFDGLAWQIEGMLIGHVEMAYLIARAQNYEGLKGWIEYYYSNTMPTPLNDDFTVSGRTGGNGLNPKPILPNLSAHESKNGALDPTATLQHLAQMSFQSKTGKPQTKGATGSTLQSSSSAISDVAKAKEDQARKSWQENSDKKRSVQGPGGNSVPADATTTGQQAELASGSTSIPSVAQDTEQAPAASASKKKKNKKRRGNKKR
jgi:hypothetical protein